MRALWELLKRFPTMPPFGEIWFASLREMDNPVSLLRLDWIFLSIVEDRRLDYERRKDDAEYGGLCAQPGVLASIKGWNKEEGRYTAGGFKIEIDTSAYEARFDRAVAGHVDVKPQREDVTAMVKKKREEMRRTGAPPAIQQLIERRRRDAGRYDADDEDDGLIVE